MLPKQEILLSPIQQVRLELYREFGNEAKEAFDFIIGNDAACGVAAPESVAPANPYKDADGVYIIYKDGSYELFTGHNGKENVKYVGLIYNGRHIAVALNNLGGEDKEYQFLKDGASAPEESVYYTCQMGICAFEDFAGKANTEHIKNEYDSEIPFDLLENGEYIPAMGEWGLLMMFASRINEALVYVGGTPLKGWLWSSTENSQPYAWYVDFDGGYANNYYKSYSGSVRAVAAF